MHFKVLQRFCVSPTTQASNSTFFSSCIFFILGLKVHFRNWKLGKNTVWGSYGVKVFNVYTKILCVNSPISLLIMRPSVQRVHQCPV